MKKISIFVDKNSRDLVFRQKYYDRMSKVGDVCIYDRDDFSDMDYAYDFVAGSEVIVTSWGSPVIDAKILELCPDLKAVLHAAGSIKAVLTPELTASDVRLTNSAAAIGEGVAESALALAISASKRFFWFRDDLKAGKWYGLSEKVQDFYDIKVGVISGGYVGRHMVKLLKNFHVDILMYDPLLSAEEIAEIGAEKVELETIMSECEVISIHAPQIPATNDMINKDNLKLIKDGAVLINTARGSIINEADLIEELKKGRFYACIDVTNPEPPLEDNELRSLDNVVLMPHIAGVCSGAPRIALHVCEELERVEKGEKMRTEIDRKTLDTIA